MTTKIAQAFCARCLRVTAHNLLRGARENETPENGWGRCTNCEREEQFCPLGISAELAELAREEEAEEDAS